MPMASGPAGARRPQRVLIANRGEIALRIVRTVRDLGGTSILPYTPEDLMSPAAELADEAYALPQGSSYTDGEAILALAVSTGAEAIHPGYGFLAEDDAFAQAVIDAGLIWVGPSPSAMRALGDKMTARATAERAGVAPVPGITDSVTSASVVLAFAHAHGYPVALKRTDGGGGRGITVLANDDEVRATPAFEAAASGGATLILERFITAARHVETQCVRDARAPSPSSRPATAHCSDAIKSSWRRPQHPSCPPACTSAWSRTPAACWTASATWGWLPVSSS